MGKAFREPQLSIKLSFIVLAEYSVNLVSCLTPEHLRVIPVSQIVLRLLAMIFMLYFSACNSPLHIFTYTPSPSPPYQPQMTYPLCYLQEKAKIVSI